MIEVVCATVRGVPGVEVMRATDGGHRGWVSPLPVQSFTFHADDVVTDRVPLTVTEVTQADLDALTGVTTTLLVTAGQGSTLTGLRTRLLEAHAHAKPDEPLGRGAVAIDTAGLEWVRAAGPTVARGWVQFETRQTGIRWTEIKAVRVDSDGKLT